MKVFLTGGMGFIGSHITMELLQNGHEVTLLARNPNKVAAFNKIPGLHIVQGGMENRDLIAATLPGHDACIHNALFWGDSAVEMLMKDTMSTVFLLETAANAGIKHFVYTSSTAAMGEFRPNMNEESKCKPVDYYGATKEASEAYLLGVAAKTSMRCNIVRPGYTFGNPVVEGAPMEVDDRFRQIVKNALNGTDIKLTQYDGTQFIWAGDLAKVFRAALESNKNREIYFGLGKDFTSWEKIAQEAIKLAGSKSQILLEDKGYGKDPFLFDLSKIKQEFGFAFESWDRLVDHVKYLVENQSAD
jgi:UDP-glucose 4-epimerase